MPECSTHRALRDGLVVDIAVEYLLSEVAGMAFDVDCVADAERLGDFR